MVEKNETVSVNVWIAERMYPLKVLKTDEEKIRNAVNLVNEKIKGYQESYAGKDKQDYIAMCLLNFAVENMNADVEIQQHNRLLEEKIARLEAILSVSSK